MEEAPENGKESSHSADANGMNEPCQLTPIFTNHSHTPITHIYKHKYKTH